MTAASDTPAPGWALSWACALAGAEPSACARVPCNDVNAVYRLDFGRGRLFLKVGPRLRPEYERLRWLEGRLPAPRPLGWTSQGDTDALLTAALAGQGLASLASSLPPQDVITRLASALRDLHCAPVDDWPFGEDGPVLVHGDACLPNFLFTGERLSGYLDVGDMARGEPEVDLAAAVWSLQFNMGPGHGVAFLREYGLTGADEDEAERLRRMYAEG